MFINCPNMDTAAASHLILAQNTVQNSIQYEVYHFWAYSFYEFGPLKGIWNRLLENHEENGKFFRGKAYRRNCEKRDLRAAPAFRKAFKLSEWNAHAMKAVHDHDDWLANRFWHNYDWRDVPTIIVTETRLAGKFITDTDNGIGIISVAFWKEFFRPASALEFVLTSVQRLSLRMSFVSDMKSHYPTRGCLWDFTAHQPDVRIGSALGFLCETCMSTITPRLSIAELDDIQRLIKNDWIGSRDDQGSVSGHIWKHYRYDLTRYSGLHTGFFSQTWRAIPPEAAKFFGEVAKWLAIVILSTWFLASCPATRAIIKHG